MWHHLCFATLTTRPTREVTGLGREMSDDRQAHWDSVYSRKSENQLSWHQDDPGLSLELAELTGLSPESSVIDIGGGTSRLAAALRHRGIRDISVLDLSAVALKAARERMGTAGEGVTWIAADVTAWHPGRCFDLWHDRAVFHFLVDEADRRAYLARLEEGVCTGGHAIIATFAPDGPETCSGLPVARYSPETLAETLGDGFQPVASRLDLHQTPWGAAQSFQYSLFRKAS